MSDYTNLESGGTYMALWFSMPKPDPMDVRDGRSFDRHLVALRDMLGSPCEVAAGHYVSGGPDSVTRHHRIAFYGEYLEFFDKPQGEVDSDDLWRARERIHAAVEDADIFAGASEPVIYPLRARMRHGGPLATPMEADHV